MLSDESVDRLGDIVEASGWDCKTFEKNPIALFNHDKNMPIGRWSNLRVEKGSLRGRLDLANAGTSARVDEIRSLVEQGILRAVSVGFMPLKHVGMEKGHGRRYQQQELLEASLVSVPANCNAMRIAKSIGISDETAKIVFSDQGDGRQLSKEVVGATRNIVVKLQEARMAKKPIAEQIAGFEFTRSAKTASMEAIMELSGDKGETLDKDQQVEYDDLMEEVEGDRRTSRASAGAGEDQRCEGGGGEGRQHR